jgi:pimeloyl-ACP methyl ester carboxylesterase
VVSSVIPPPPPVAQVQTPTGPIAYRRTPTTGPRPHEPAVLVHGLGGNALNWTDLGYALADRLDGVAMDLPGFGRTEPTSPADYTVAGHVRAVVGVIEALFPGQPVHLFGNSMGGAIALQVAARHPDLVRTLCLVSPALPDLRMRRTNIHIPVMTVPGVGTRLFDRFARVGVERRVQATYDLCFADPSRVHPQRLAEAHEEARRRDTQAHVRDAFIGSTSGLVTTFLDRGLERPWALASRVQAPTLLVYGRRDKLVDARAAHRATKAFPNAHVMVIPDSGHVAQMEHPELVDRWWREFLGSAPDGRPARDGREPEPVREG